LNRSTAAERVVLAVLAALVATFVWRSLGWPLIHDAPILHYIAWRISHGAAPYRDLFDMNFPGSYGVELAAIRLFGLGDAGWRLFDLLMLGAGGVCVAAVAAPWGRVSAASAGLFFALVHLAGGPAHAGQRDFIIAPLLLLGVLGVARWSEAKGSLSSLVWSALALGAAVTIKPHTAGLGLALLFAIGVLARRGGGSPWRPMGWFAAGLVLMPALAVAWVAWRGGLAAWDAIVFEYLPLYARLGRAGDWAFYGWRVWLVIVPGVLVSLGATIAARRFTVRHALVGLGLAYGVLHYFGQRKGWEYHLYPLAAFASVALFAGLSARPNERRDLVTAMILGCIAVATTLLAVRCARARDATWISVAVQRVDALTRDLRSRLSPGDQVQVLDTTDGGLHALLRLGVQQPTRFLYDFHFYHDVQTPVVQALRAEFLRELDANPPRCIVLLENGYPTGGFERVQGFRELQDRLARYPDVSRGDGYIIYAH
jgi:hypothetical protein